MKTKKLLALALAVLMLVAAAIPVGAAENIIDENSGWYWPTVNRTITSGFGVARGSKDYHQGIDIRANVGADVYAARPGTVYCSGWDNSMGNYITILHEGKTAEGKYLLSTYMHLSQRLVTKGQKVSGGELIGKAGNTGESYGAHLHFHVIRSDSKAPAKVSPKRPTKAELNKHYIDVGAVNYNGGTSSAPAASTLGISVTSHPSRIKVGTAWGMRGSVTSNYTITRVDGAIYNAWGTKVMSSQDYPNSTRMDIRYSQVNNALMFNYLGEGSYRLVITATDASGKTQRWESGFEVYAESTLRINMTSSPSSIRKGRCFGLRGTISSNYTITGVQGEILNSRGQVVDSTWDSPNSNSFNVRYGNINNYLEFNWLARGSYTLRITAYDASGRVVTWSRSFCIY